LNSTLDPLSYGSAQTEVSAAGFAELANGPDFPRVKWMTMVYHADLNKLSVYGYEQAIDHHLVVTGLDSRDEKRVVEVLAAFGITEEEAIREALRTKRRFLSFVSSSLGV